MLGTLSQTHAGAQQDVARSRQGHAARDGGQVRPKAKLKWGGYVAELVASGEAEIGVHQISEIVRVKGAVFVGPLPAENQNATGYSAGIGARAKDASAAKALIEFLASPASDAILKEKGMERP
jgi:molybdate transport system substrate-binding protein